MTVKGAAVTFTSTFASCTLACYIEIGAHRVVYHYFPHKYANVEQANGLTQEQLDAVRVHHVDRLVTMAQGEEKSELEEKAEVLVEETSQNTLIDNFTVEPISRNSRDSFYGFWKEERRDEDHERPAPIFPLGRTAFSSNDILACSMTC